MVAQPQPLSGVQMICTPPPTGRLHTTTSITPSTSIRCVPLSFGLSAAPLSEVAKKLPQRELWRSGEFAPTLPPLPTREGGVFAFADPWFDPPFRCFFTLYHVFPFNVLRHRQNWVWCLLTSSILLICVPWRYVADASCLFTNEKQMTPYRERHIYESNLSLHIATNLHEIWKLLAFQVCQKLPSKAWATEIK